MVKGRQIGATTMASAVEMYFMGCGMFVHHFRPPLRVMHAFPQLELAAAYSKTKLGQMISRSEKSGRCVFPTSRTRPKSHMQLLLDQSAATNDSLHFKQFIGGNHLWIESTGVDADRIMGRSCDIIFFDECQKAPHKPWEMRLKSLPQPEIWSPLQRRSKFTSAHQDARGATIIRCGSLPLNNTITWVAKVVKNIFHSILLVQMIGRKYWIHTMIVKCPHCQHEQNKLSAAERGKWMALKDANDEDCTFIGFHINQLYMPMFSREDIENEKPGKHPINTERVYMNEVLESFSKAIVAPSPRRNPWCDIGRKFSPRIEATPGLTQQMALLGIDYGARADLEQMAQPDKIKSSGRSYSTAVVLLTKGPGLLSIEFATKFKRNDPESKRGIIERIELGNTTFS